MDIVEQIDVYSVSSQGKLHIKRWENDGLVFKEGPGDTHLVNLATIHLLEFLSSNSGSSRDDIKDYLRVNLGLEFSDVDFQRMLLALLNNKIVSG